MNKYCHGCGNSHIKYRKTLRPLMSEEELRVSFAEGENFEDHGRQMNLVAHVMPVIDVQWGVADTARVMPVNSERAIVWIAIFKKDKQRAVTAREFFAPRR